VYFIVSRFYLFYFIVGGGEAKEQQNIVKYVFIKSIHPKEIRNKSLKEHFIKGCKY